MVKLDNIKLWVTPVTKEPQIVKVGKKGVIQGKTDVDPFLALSVGVVGIVHNSPDVDLHNIELDTNYGKYRVSIEAIYEPEE